MGLILFILYTQPLSGVIDHHSVPHHMFADDTELYKSETRGNSHVDSVFSLPCTLVSLRRYAVCLFVSLLNV